VKADEVLVVLPREDSVVRNLELPMAPSEEVPTLVRFQAAAKSSISLDQLLLDYLPLPPREDGSGLDVLMSTVPVKFVNHIQAVLTAAGLELASLSISPTATAELVARADHRTGDASGADLVIARHGNRVEISFIRNRRLLFTHSTRLTGDDERLRNQAVLAEISRASVALQRQLAGNSITRAWVLGTADDNLSLCEALQTRFQCEVGTIDPLAVPGVELTTTDVPGDRALYAGPVGMLLAQSGGLTESLDFLNPRRPPARRDSRKLKAGLIAAGALFAAAVGYGGLHLYLAGLDAEIRDKVQMVAELEDSVKRGRPQVESAQLVEDWIDGSVHWLDRMEELAATMQGTERLYLSKVDFDSKTGRSSVGEIKGEGVARDRSDVYSLYKAIGEHARTEVHTKEIPQTSTDADYPYKFWLDVDLKREAE
jgi:hypothetical protein